MLKKKAAVQVVSPGILPEDTIMVGEQHLNQWKLIQGQYVTLRFGAFKQPVKVLPVKRFEGIRLNQTLARRLGICAGASLRLHYRPSSMTLAIGPLIGVLISRDYPGATERPFGAITQFCKELVDACKTFGAYVYFFTPEHIDAASDTALMGWIYNGGWQRLQMPVPDVINNRLTTRKLENKPSVQHFFRDVKSRIGTQIFNEKFLDKSEVFDALRNQPLLQKYLPESHVLHGLQTLRQMCAKHASVFLKPVRGSLGKGIIRITRTELGYQVHYATPLGARKETYSSLQRLYSSLAGKTRSVTYQVQQGLQLMENQRRPVDFRALVQKNATGTWAVTSIVARIAGSQHFVSNLARGGTLSSVKDAVLKSSLPTSAKKEAYARLQRASIEIAKGIEAGIDAHFGELGIDLALDTQGKVWLLEVNAKPSKNDNTPLQAEQKVRPSVRIMLQYAGYLSGFN